MAIRACARTATETALAALDACGHIDPAVAETLRQGWRFLRRLEQRLRIAHGTSATLIEEGALGLPALARRMGLLDAPRADAVASLLDRYAAVTREVRAAYSQVLGLGE